MWEKIRYLIAGFWNTVFGFGLFWLMRTVLPELHYGYALIICNELAILNAYVSYRIFVFKSRGRILGELFRFHGVYAVATVLSMGLTAALVEIAHLDPVVANGCALVVTVVVSYVSHKKVTFRQSSAVKPVIGDEDQIQAR